MPKLYILFLVFVLGCAGVSAQSGFWSCPDGFAGQTLRVYNWTTYIAEDTISNFERICGATVVYNTYGSDGDMLEELRAGDAHYDIVVPSNANVALMIDEGLLQPIGQLNLSNLDNLSAQFRDPIYDPDNHFTVPYQWGTIGIGYNRAVLGRDITTWEEVFNGSVRVAWLDESRPMLGVALKMLGFDPNTNVQAEIDSAADYLIAHGANVVAIAPDTGQDLLQAGQVDITVEYNGDIYQLIEDCACDDYRYIIPEEGGQFWTDNLAIPLNAENPELATVFIDYILNAQVGADISNYTAYASPNQAAIDQGLIYETYLSNPAIYPPEESMQALFSVTTSAELEPLYTAAWERVLSSVGR